MTRRAAVSHEFVDFIPDDLREGTIYVCIEFATAVHKCLCGCGREVVTPLSPTGWSLIFDGETTSLDPSIGNWSFPCQSHYWIRQNNAIWAHRWSRSQIETGQHQERAQKTAYYGIEENRAGEKRDMRRKRLWSRIKEWLRQKRHRSGT